MRKLLIISVAFLLMGCFSAPSSPEAKQVKETVSTDRFFTVNLSGGFEILVDRETRVQYLLYTPNMYNGYMSVMMDSLGKPILYEGEISK